MRKILDVSIDMPRIFLFISPRDLEGYQKRLVGDGMRIFMALPKRHRLIKKLDFDKVFKEGRAVKGSSLFIRSRSNELNFPRFGFVVPKKIYSRAVDRNRLERVLSETAALFIKNNPTSGRDSVVVVRRQEEEVLIKNELTNLLKDRQ